MCNFICAQELFEESCSHMQQSQLQVDLVLQTNDIGYLFDFQEHGIRIQSNDYKKKYMKKQIKNEKFSIIYQVFPFSLFINLRSSVSKPQ